jgi:hypothetical protein
MRREFCLVRLTTAFVPRPFGRARTPVRAARAGMRRAGDCAPYLTREALLARMRRMFRDDEAPMTNDGIVSVISV